LKTLEVFGVVVIGLELLSHALPGLGSCYVTSFMLMSPSSMSWLF
jgi:hypothetical protein